MSTEKDLSICCKEVMVQPNKIVQKWPKVKIKYLEAIKVNVTFYRECLFLNI